MPTSEADPDALRSIDAPPPQSLSGDPFADDWLGHPWTNWTALPNVPTRLTGLYRARAPGEQTLHYIGQGMIAGRIASHRGHPHRFPPETVWSWTATPHTANAQLVEPENDLIASHLLTVGVPPAEQFLGSGITRDDPS